MKKITSIFITLAMIVSIFPTFVFAKNDISTDINESGYYTTLNDPDALPDGYVDNSNEAMFELQEMYEQQNTSIQLMAANENDLTGKKVEIAFLIDASGSMSSYIAKVKENVTAMAQYFESAGVNLRMAVVRFGASEDGNRAQVLKINGSSWHTSTEQLVETLSNISANGGTEALSDAIGDILNKNPLTGETNIHWSSDAYKFAFVLTDDFDYGVEGSYYNDYGYETLNSTIPDLQEKRIPVSVVTGSSYFSRYKQLATETGGALYNIGSADYLQLLLDYANNAMNIALKAKKAIYILPGYMGSKLYDENNIEKWADMDYIKEDIIQGTLPGGKKSIFPLNENGENSQVYDGIHKSDISIDEYGSQDTYKNLVTKLRNEFAGEYDIIFYPYNWLADLNDEALELQSHINRNGYENIILITHSTGGLLASTYIAKNSNNKKKVEKAILIAPPLLGTYSSLVPIEYGKNDFLVKKLEEMKIPGLLHGAVFSWVKSVVKNSPTTYQLLPSEEYIKLMPQIYSDDFDKNSAVVSSEEYYNILNGSENINPKLTNGSNRSHKYLRETVFGGNVVNLWDGNIVDTLQEVDTILIGTNKGHMTPAIASYKGKLFGGTKIDDMIYKDDGDGTVLNVSAFAMREKDKHVLKYKDFSYLGFDHGELASKNEALSYICDYIRGVETTASSPVSLMSANEDDGMSNYIKMRYTADKPIEATIYNTAKEIVAHISMEDIMGIDSNNFAFDPFVLTNESTDVLLHLPNTGYKVVFSYGDTSNVPVDFTNTISCLNSEGFKTTSVISSATTTLEGGIISSIDLGNKILTKDNIVSEIPNDSSVEYYTDWNIPDEISVKSGDTKKIELAGTDSEKVASLLNWTSANPEVLEVSNDGTLTAIGYGKTVISVTDGNKVLSAVAVVPQEATSIEIPDINLTIGERKLIKPNFVPSSTTERDMEYELSKEGIIEIDEFGVIKALNAGSVTVTGKTDYGIKDTFIVTVMDETNYAVQSIEIVPSTISVTNGKTAAFKVNFTPENATNKELNWLVEDETLINISNNEDEFVVTGLKEGSTKITAISVDGGYTAEATVNVKKKTSSSSGGGTTTYTVKFDTDGGNKVSNKIVSKNNTLAEPTAPKKDGFTFEGWYLDKALTQRYDFASKVTKNFTLFAKWEDIKKSQIILKIGEKEALVFGEAKENDVAPKIVKDRTMLPIRFIAEALGADVEWDGISRKVTIVKDDIEIIITIDSDKAIVTGKTVTLDSSAFIENDRTYLPLRFISENLGAKVEWDETTQTVTITK